MIGKETVESMDGSSRWKVWEETDNFGLALNLLAPAKCPSPCRGHAEWALATGAPSRGTEVRTVSIHPFLLTEGTGEAQCQEVLYLD